MGAAIMNTAGVAVCTSPATKDMKVQEDPRGRRKGACSSGTEIKQGNKVM